MLTYFLVVLAVCLAIAFACITKLSTRIEQLEEQVIGLWELLDENQEVRERIYYGIEVNKNRMWAEIAQLRER